MLSDKEPDLRSVPRSSKRMASAAVFLLVLIGCPTWGVGGLGYLRIAAVGDIMMGTTYPRRILPLDDGMSIFWHVRQPLEGADIVFGNLEGPLIDEGRPSKCRSNSNGTGLCYEFRMPARYAAYLAASRFNVVSIANNHILDFGIEGLDSTLELLTATGVKPVGGNRFAHFNVRGSRVVVAGFSCSRSTKAASILQLDRAVATVRNLKKSNDIVIVSFHGGAEGREALHVADVYERFANEIRGNVVRFSRTVIDAGADMVIGHGPHVPRAMEVYRGKLIAYSLGNFLTYGRFNTSGPNGLSLILQARLDVRTGNFISGRIVPLRLRSDGIPFLDEEGESIRLIKDLTAKDIGVMAVAIEENGDLYPPAPQIEKSRLGAVLDYFRDILGRASNGP